MHNHNYLIKLQLIIIQECYTLCQILFSGFCFYFCCVEQVVCGCVVSLCAVRCVVRHCMLYRGVGVCNVENLNDEILFYFVPFHS